MTNISNISSVAYKKGNWMRYTLWILAAVCIGMLIHAFITTMNGEVSANVPDDYRFALTDNYAEGSHIRTSYYVYDDKILVEDESFDDHGVNRVVMIYDNINTTSLYLDSEDTIEICELGSCGAYPKVLATIKSLISRKIGREYIGF
ncbi:hypothetical protein IJG89_03430 [Candidatus Saccharibacteria bacterium]|nr:hypothetical protein [Candidatus Saccharibacteria bacterium]